MRCRRRCLRWWWSRFKLRLARFGRQRYRSSRLQRRRRVIDVLNTRNDPFTSLFEPLLCYS